MAALLTANNKWANVSLQYSTRSTMVSWFMVHGSSLNEWSQALENWMNKWTHSFIRFVENLLGVGHSVSRWRNSGIVPDFIEVTSWGRRRQQIQKCVVMHIDRSVFKRPGERRVGIACTGELSFRNQRLSWDQKGGQELTGRRGGRACVYSWGKKLLHIFEVGKIRPGRLSVVSKEGPGWKGAAEKDKSKWALQAIGSILHLVLGTTESHRKVLSKKIT